MNHIENINIPIIRCFFIHRDIRYSYNLAFKFPRDSKIVMLLSILSEYIVTYNKAGNSWLFRNFSFLLESIASNNYKNIFSYSRSPVSHELVNRFIELTPDERNIIIDCLRNSPKILVPNSQ